MLNVLLEETLVQNLLFSLSFVNIVLFVSGVNVLLQLLDWIDDIIVSIHVLVEEIVVLRSESMVSADFFCNL